MPIAFFFSPGEAGNLPIENASQGPLFWPSTAFTTGPIVALGLTEVSAVLAPLGRLVLAEEIFEDDQMGADHLDEAGLGNILETNGFKVQASGVHRAGDVDLILVRAQLKQLNPGHRL